MSVQNYTSKIKPLPWDVSIAGVATAWQDIRNGLVITLPLWEHGEQLRDAVSGVTSSTSYGTPQWQYTPYGIGMYTDEVNNSGIEFDDHPQFRLPDTAVTVAVGVTLPATQTEAAFFLGKTVFSGYYATYGIRAMGNYWAGNDVQSEIYVGTTQYPTTIDGGQGLTVGVPYLITMRWASGESVEQRIYRRDTGELVNVVTSVASPSGSLAYDTWPLQVGHYRNIDPLQQSTNAIQEVGYVWDRKLDISEIEQLVGDPFGPIRPALTFDALKFYLQWIGSVQNYGPDSKPLQWNLSNDLVDPEWHRELLLFDAPLWDRAGKEPVNLYSGQLADPPQNFPIGSEFRDGEHGVYWYSDSSTWGTGPAWSDPVSVITGLATNAVTVELRFRIPASGPVTTRTLVIADQPAGFDIDLVYNAGQYDLRVRRTTSSVYPSATWANIPTGQWLHVVITVPQAGTAPGIYVNGEVVTLTAVVAGSGTGYEARRLQLGLNATANTPEADIEYLRIWKGVMGQDFAAKLASDPYGPLRPRLPLNTYRALLQAWALFGYGVSWGHGRASTLGFKNALGDVEALGVAVTSTDGSKGSQGSGQGQGVPAALSAGAKGGIGIGLGYSYARSLIDGLKGGQGFGLGYDTSSVITLGVKGGTGIGLLLTKPYTFGDGVKAVSGFGATNSPSSIIEVGVKGAIGDTQVHGYGWATTQGTKALALFGNGFASAYPFGGVLGGKGGEGFGNVTAYGVLTSVGLKGAIGVALARDYVFTTSLGAKTGLGEALTEAYPTATVVGVKEAQGVGRTAGYAWAETVGSKTFSLFGQGLSSAYGYLTGSGGKGGIGEAVTHGTPVIVAVGIKDGVGISSITAASSMSALGLKGGLGQTYVVGYGYAYGTQTIVLDAETIDFIRTIVRTVSPNLAITRNIDGDSLTITRDADVNMFIVTVRDFSLEA